MINPDISKYMIGNTTNLVPNKASSNRSPSSLLNNDHLENRCIQDNHNYLLQINKKKGLILIRFP